MNNPEVVVVLGGNVPHRSLIKELKSRGYLVVLIDYLDNPPAKSVADIHVQESTLDTEKVLEICKEYNAKYLIDACIDRPIPVVGYVSEKLGLTCPFGYEESLIGTNKNLMKRMMIDNGIPTSRFVKITDISQLNDIMLKHPLIVKPSDASGSIGITKVDVPEELEDNVRIALEASRNGEAIVEEFVSGKEIQVDCFVVDGNCEILVMKEKRKFRTDILTLSYGSMIPAYISNDTAIRIHKTCNDIAKTLKLNHSPLFVQLLIGENDISVIEFGLRIGGMLSYKMIEQIAGVDVLSATIDAYTGKRPDIKLNPITTIYTTNHIFPKEGIYDKVIGVEELLRDNIISDYTQFMRTGTHSDGRLESKDRIGTFTITANDLTEYNEKMKEAVRRLDVLDICGNSIMRKDIYNI